MLRSNIKSEKQTQYFPPNQIWGGSATQKIRNLRNPLTSIDLAIEILNHGVKVKFDKTLLHIIQRNSERLNELISEVLEFETATEPDEPKYSLQLIIDEALDVMHERIKNRRIYLQIDHDEQDRFVTFNPTDILDAFTNIIENALEAMGPDEGVLRVVTRSTKVSYSIEIWDTGHGMTPETIGRIFEPYFTTKPGALGLGLTKAIESLHSINARVKVKSLPGKGSGFIILFGRN